MSFLIQGRWERKSSKEKPGLALTADMATQYPPEELGRMLSGKPGRFSTKVSMPPLFRPATCTLQQKQSPGHRWVGPAARISWSWESPSDPGHGGLCHQNRLLIWKQVDAVWEAEVVHDDGQLFGFGVKLQNSAKRAQTRSKQKFRFDLKANSTMTGKESSPPAFKLLKSSL